MNFFEDQERARKNTRILICLFSVVVFITAFLTSVAVTIGVYLYQSSQTDLYEFPGYSKFVFSEPHLFIKMFLIVAFVIFFVSWIKSRMLRGGGPYIARKLGAKEVDPFDKNESTQQLVNIVEEMSLASGTPMPSIFILENESSINAFAAGYDINDAAICVTEGTLRKLNRDELQGVVAHEFSHIFNGDMRIGIELIAYLAGLQFIFELGYRISDLSSYSRHRRNRRGDSGNIAFVALAIMVIGGLGRFFACLIKSYVSKQREFLADASAVQYTRNPEGIGNALKKIWALSTMKGIKGIKSSHTDEFNHLFFSQALESSLFRFETHPPLTVRIKAIFPHFDPRKVAEEEKERLVADLYAGMKKAAKEKSEESKKPVLSFLMTQNLEFFRRMLKENKSQRNSSSLLIYALFLLITKDQMKVWDILRRELDQQEISDVEFYLSKISKNREFRILYFLDLLKGSLKAMDRDRLQKISYVAMEIAICDRDLNINEMILCVYVTGMAHPIPKLGLDGLKPRWSIVRDGSRFLSFLYAIQGHGESGEEQKLYLNLLGKLPLKFEFIAKSKLVFSDFFESFQTLRSANPKDKIVLVEAMDMILISDGELSPLEEDLRTICHQLLGIPSTVK